jgi:alkylhydroperoxidase family enzyme
MDRLILGERGIRIGLLALAIPQLGIGIWAVVSPSGWFETFPGAGNNWLPLYGPFSEHLAVDVGSAFLAIGVMVLLAAIWMDRRLVIAAATAYLVYQVPHTIFHLGADDVLTSADQVVNGVALALAVLLPPGIILGALRQGSDPSGGSRDAGSVPSVPRTEGTDPTGAGDGVARLGPSPGGVVARLSRVYAKRRFGRELAPVDAYLHHRRLLVGYSVFETATERSHCVDERLKLLAELKAAAVVGCEWCMDFGSNLARIGGVPDRQLRELPLYRESDAFDERERLVLDLATAMSRTPAEVDDELFARLRERFDDAQLVELANAIAIENLRARFNHALGLESQGFSEGAACVVPELAERAGRIVAAGDRQPRSPDAV